jgi:hypothetical protein
MWPRLASLALGVWLMAAPAALGYGDPARTNDRVVGPIVASIACVAVWEVVRALRWVNVVPALWLLTAPWVLGYERDAAVNSVAVGLALLALVVVRGPVRQRFGGGWRALLRSPDGPP